MGELAADAGITSEELALAARNHAMPLEALRWPVTPVGLHYLLIHFDVPLVDASSWRLELGGRVQRPLSLSLDELRARPAEELVATMECAGNGRALLEPRPRSQPWLTGAVGTGRWRGAPLDALLADAGLEADAVELVFTGLDRGIDGGEEQLYARSLTPADAAGSLLAYELNGQPLPPQHGFPLRLVVPGWYGMTNVKWLGSITAVETPFAGFQQVEAYRLRAEEGADGPPVTRMQPRALLVPPGIPDFFTRSRMIEPGSTRLEGRAWSGQAPIARVEVSTDDGETWADAELFRDLDSRWAWCGWRLIWEAEPGEHVLCCRAYDEAGNAQPLGASWNVGGYENNAVQRVPVSVTGRP
ncbi:MAG TPA: sulfite oxidase [Gaiellaceae bacterium]|nr:sulfite oxidase [Gaiellaceae bacterium]